MESGGGTKSGGDLVQRDHGEFTRRSPPPRSASSLGRKKDRLSQSEHYATTSSQTRSGYTNKEPFSIKVKRSSSMEYGGGGKSGGDHLVQSEHPGEFTRRSPPPRSASSSGRKKDRLSQSEHALVAGMNHDPPRSGHTTKQPSKGPFSIKIKRSSSMEYGGTGGAKLNVKSEHTHGGSSLEGPRKPPRRGHSVSSGRKKDRLSQSEHVLTSKQKTPSRYTGTTTLKRSSLTSLKEDDAPQPQSSVVVNPVSVSRRAHMARGRNDMLRSLEAEYQTAKYEKEQDVNMRSLREQLEDIKEKWIHTRTESDTDIEALRKELNRQKETILGAHIAAVDNFRKTEYNFNLEVLQEENDSLKVELESLSASREEATKEREELEATFKQIAKQIEEKRDEITKAEHFESNMADDEMTAEGAQIRPTVEKVGTILNGITALKNVYRRNMYKCLAAVHSSEYYDHLLFTETEEEVQQCEQKLDSDFLDQFSNEYLQLVGGEQQEQEDAVGGEQVDEEEADHVDESTTSEPVIPDEEDIETIDVSQVTKEAEERAEELLSKISKLLREEEISSLYKNKYVLSGVFLLLDKDGGGTIDPDEFRKGLDVLNKRLSSAAQFEDPDELFRAIDVDGSGEIDVEEFEAFFALNSILAAKKKKKKKKKKAPPVAEDVPQEEAEPGANNEFATSATTPPDSIDDETN
jgi:hypothetical protein